MAGKRDEGASVQPTAEELAKIAAVEVAARAQAEAAAARAKEEEGFVSMSKDGETLKVHPGCVADHRRCGWKITA